MIWRTIIVTAIVLVLVLLSTPPRTHSAPPLPLPAWARAMTGTAGESLGPVSLGQTRQVVFLRLGRPDEIERSGENHYWAWDLGRDRYVVSWTVPDPGVDYIFTDSPAGTVGGVSPGSTFREMIERLGYPVRAAARFGTTYFEYPGVRVAMRTETLQITSVAVIPKSVR